MSGWIKFWKDTNDDPRLVEASRRLADSYVFANRRPGGGADLSPGDALRFAGNALRGALAALWCYADEHIRNDDTLPISSHALDAMIGLDGFSGILPKDWIIVLDDGTVQLPGYCAKNQLIAKEKRASDNKARQARYRQRHRVGSNGVHNGAHVEIVTRNGAVTKCVDSDSDSDQDLDKKRSKNPSAHRTAPIAPLEFMDFKIAYPNRAGDQGWRKALRAAHARIEEGFSWAEILEGAKRYAAYVRSTGNEGTEFVKQAATFLGPDLFFQQAWDPPKTKVENMRDANVEASKEWLHAS